MLDLFCMLRPRRVRYLLSGFDILQWCLSVLFPPRLPSAGTLNIWLSTLCFASHFSLDPLSSALIGGFFSPYHITSFKLAAAFKRSSAIDSVPYLFVLGCQSWTGGKLCEWWNICSMNSLGKWQTSIIACGVNPLWELKRFVASCSLWKICLLSVSRSVEVWTEAEEKQRYGSVARSLRWTRMALPLIEFTALFVLTLLSQLGLEDYPLCVFPLWHLTLQI